MNRSFALFVLLAGCYSPNIGNGQLKCSSDGKCPDGFHCATNKTCWKNGSDPNPSPMPDMAGGDMKPLPDLSPPNPGDMGPPVTPGKTASSMMTGGVTAKSEHYKMIMSTGQPPGGNTNAAGTSNTKRAGVPGVTQPK
jgi:hypothetical protein